MALIANKNLFRKLLTCSIDSNLDAKKMNNSFLSKFSWKSLCKLYEQSYIAGTEKHEKTTTKTPHDKNNDLKQTSMYTLFE